MRSVTMEEVEREKRKILLKIFGSFVAVAVIAFLFTVAHAFAEGDDITIDEYKATFYPDGTLVEEFTYTIRAQSYSMLFRLWDAPLSIYPLGYPYVELVDIEAADTGFWYIEDSLGMVYVDETYPESSRHKQEIGDLAYRNEAGSYNPNYYSPGTYTIRYTFKLHPPIEYDDDDAHLNLMLAREHMAYKNFTLVFEDADYIDKFYPHPPYLKVSREGGRIVVTGSSGEDELIEVEMLIDLDALEAMDGFPTRVEGVRFKTVIANIDTYENFEKMFNSLLLNVTKLREDLDEANLEIFSIRSELDEAGLELEEKRSELNKAYDKITIFKVVAMVAFVAGLSLMYIISKRGKVIP